MKLDDRSPGLPVRGIELERWRTGVGLTTVEAAAAFGMDIRKWKQLTSRTEALLPVSDPTIALLFHLYCSEPQSAPARLATDVPDFYAFLGFKHNQNDYERFAMLVGRSTASIIRLLHHDGNPSRALTCWIEALARLRLSPRQTLQLMEKTAKAATGGARRVRTNRSAVEQNATQGHHG